MYVRMCLHRLVATEMTLFVEGASRFSVYSVLDAYIALDSYTSQILRTHIAKMMVNIWYQIASGDVC